MIAEKMKMKSANLCFYINGFIELLPSLGILCSLLIPYIVTDASVSKEILFLIYFLQLGSIVLVFLSYKRTIYIAGQQEYRCIQIDLYVMIAIQIVQISTLAILKNYILFLAIQLSTTIFANTIISTKVDHVYPFLKGKYTILFEDIKKRNIIPDIKNFEGVQLGTLAGFMPIAYRRIRFVIKHYFGQSISRYIGRHLLLSIVVLLEGTICHLITS